MIHPCEPPTDQQKYFTDTLIHRGKNFFLNTCYFSWFFGKIDTPWKKNFFRLKLAENTIPPKGVKKSFFRYMYGGDICRRSKKWPKISKIKFFFRLVSVSNSWKIPNLSFFSRAARENFGYELEKKKTLFSNYVWWWSYLEDRIRQKKFFF